MVASSGYLPATRALARLEPRCRRATRPARPGPPQLRAGACPRLGGDPLSRPSHAGRARPELALSPSGARPGLVPADLGPGRAPRSGALGELGLEHHDAVSQDFEESIRWLATANTAYLLGRSTAGGRFDAAATIARINDQIDQELAPALRAARRRPEQPILGLITRLGTARRLGVVWAVRAVVCHDARDLDDMIAKARATAVRAGMASAGQALVVTAGLPFGTPGATNMLRIAYVTERDG